MYIILPHIEAKLHFSFPEICNLPSDHVELAILLIFMPQIDHPIFKFSVENESFWVTPGIKLRYLPILLKKHHGVTGEFEPSRQSCFRLSLVTVQDEISESVNGTKLVYVASGDPHHLLDAILFDAIERLIKGLFELSGR